MSFATRLLSYEPTERGGSSASVYTVENFNFRNDDRDSQPWALLRMAHLEV